MPLVNCRECGKLFNKITHNICPACMEDAEQDFHKVYAYLQENELAHIDIIAEHTGVAKKRIMQFLADDRFESVKLTYRCESCGMEINSGKLCAKCLSRINKEITQIQKAAADEQGSGKGGSKFHSAPLERHGRR